MKSRYESKKLRVWKKYGDQSMMKNMFLLVCRIPLDKDSLINKFLLY